MAQIPIIGSEGKPILSDYRDPYHRPTDYRYGQGRRAQGSSY